jgi:hypothetical protein
MNVRDSTASGNSVVSGHGSKKSKKPASSETSFVCALLQLLYLELNNTADAGPPRSPAAKRRSAAVLDSHCTVLPLC